MSTTTGSGHRIDRLFSLLDEWRHLPAYQLERRADIFFAMYLDTILKAKFGDTIDLIVPEFPVRLGDLALNGSDADAFRVADSNQSFRIDYAVICEASNKVYFIELKTDQGSRRDKQDWYLEKARDINVFKLMDGLIRIYGATKHKTKYGNLISLLSKAGWLLMETGACRNTSRDYDIEVVYIQPVNVAGAANVISFGDVAGYLKDFDDELTRRFVESLGRWVADPNARA